MADDFCMIHGYDFMKRGTAPGIIATCAKCDEAKDKCPCSVCECADSPCSKCTCTHPSD